MRSKTEKKEWLGFDSFKTEETEMKKKVLWCKTLNEIIVLYSIDPGMVNISNPLTLSPLIGIDNTVIHKFYPISRIVDTMRENSADGHTQNTKYQNVTKWRVGRNGTTNSMTNITLIVHGAVVDEIKQVKWLSLLPTIEVDNADYFNKIDTYDETQKLFARTVNWKKKHFRLSMTNNFLLKNWNVWTWLLNWESMRGFSTHFNKTQVDKEDYHDQTKSKLNPFVSKYRASRNNDDYQQTKTSHVG